MHYKLKIKNESILNGNVQKGIMATITPCATTNTPWLTGGNIIGNISNTILGTCDNVDLAFETNSIPNMWLKTTGQLGLGISNPKGMLDVVVSKIGTMGGLNIYQGSSTMFSVGNDGSTLISQQALLELGNTNPPLTVQGVGGGNLFQVAYNGNVTISGAVTSGLATVTGLTSNGNVSIGGTLVSGVTTVSSLTSNGNASITGNLLSGAATVTGLTSNGSLTINTANASPFAVKNGGTNLLTLDGSGNFQSSGNVILNNGNYAGETGPSTTNAQLLLKSNGDVNHGLGYFVSFYTNKSGVPVDGPVDGPVLYGYSGGALATKNPFSTPATTNIALQWNNNGQVFIGGKKPANAPYSAAVLSVNGTMVAQEIYVENIDWADYVFKKDYKLMPLTEVEKYISQNQHLPNVPSAAEVENKGQNVGSLQVTQMEKTEELYLYIIAINKKLDKLEEQNKKLANELADLKNK